MPFQILDIFAAQTFVGMNLQDIIFPIGDAILWSFEILKMGGNNFNMLLEAIIALALVYWTIKLVGFESQEVPNR